MDKKILTIILIILLILQSVNATIATSLETKCENRSRVSVDFNLVAVIENKEKGVLIPATLMIGYPGNGTIYVTSEGEIGKVTLESTYQAIKLAALLAGVDWRNYDFNVTFHTDSGIDGPSGSMMISLVAYTLLAGSPRGVGYESYLVTGAISPDGLASSVGAVEYKCKVAEDKGLRFYYPLVNFTQKLSQECNGKGYTSLIDLVSLVYNISEPETVKPPFLLPPDFNETMVYSSMRMINKSLELVRLARELGASLTVINQIYDYTNRSKSILDSHPYASASLAFTALSRAYATYYLALVHNETYENAKTKLDDIAELVDQRLSDLEARLDSLPREGSIYYAEFIATAYTRLAAARSSIIAYYNYSTTPDLFFTEAIAELAHATARIISIEEWIRSANATRAAEPWIGEEDLKRLAWMLRDYSTTSGNYASALAEYAVKYYGRSKGILVYIEVLSNLEEKGVEYLEEGNYIATIGFFRELLSQSLNVMFQSSIQAYTGPAWVIDKYYKELSRIYTLITERLITRGITTGLAPAYYDYSLVMLSYNYTGTALQLLDEAVVSALSWDMLSLSTLPSNRTSQTITAQTVSSSSAVETLIVIVIIALSAYVFGYLSSIKSVIKLLKETYGD